MWVRESRPRHKALCLPAATGDRGESLSFERSRFFPMQRSWARVFACRRFADFRQCSCERLTLVFHRRGGGIVVVRGKGSKRYEGE
jgi:hypothetical protein